MSLPFDDCPACNQFDRMWTGYAIQYARVFGLYRYLKPVEWAMRRPLSPLSDETVSCCPYCDNAGSEQHTPDCRLKLFLDDLKVQYDGQLQTHDDGMD